MDSDKIEFVFGYQASAEIRMAKVDRRLAAIDLLLDQGMGILSRIPAPEDAAARRYQASVDSVERPSRNVH